jgi:hypothetical protein
MRWLPTGSLSARSQERSRFGALHLARLSDKATYLYVSGDRYWYGLAPSVSRMARDRAERLLANGTAEVDAEVCAAVSRQVAAARQRDRQGTALAGVHVAPSGPADVEDDDRARLVVLGPAQPYVPKSDGSPALSAARDILERRGSSPRHFRNMLVFLAADQRRLDDLRQGAADALAWRSVAREAKSKELDLTAQQEAQAVNKSTEADETLGRRLGDAYTWAIVPDQPDPTGPVTFVPVRVEGTGDLASRTAQRLDGKGDVHLRYAPSVLRTMVLGRTLSSLWDRGHVSVGELWDALARYPYLPRLRDKEVLRRSVQDGPSGFDWQAEGFALADGYDEGSGRYLGLVLGPGSGSSVTDSTLLVRPELAVQQVEGDRAVTATHRAVPGTVGPGTPPFTEPGQVPVPAGQEPVGPAKPKRFHGSVALRSERLNLEFGRVVQEVVQRLTDAGAGVEVTVEVSAHARAGFEEPVVHAVTENARTLHFRDSGFEED